MIGTNPIAFAVPNGVGGVAFAFDQAKTVVTLGAGLTGGRLSQDVKPLKAPEGEPHDLGQVFILIDPATSPDFGDRLAGLIAAVEEDGRGRLPGHNRVAMDAVAVQDALWAACEGLAG